MQKLILSSWVSTPNKCKSIYTVKQASCLSWLALGRSEGVRRSAESTTDRTVEVGSRRCAGLYLYRRGACTTILWIHLLVIGISLFPDFVLGQSIQGNIVENQTETPVGDAHIRVRDYPIVAATNAQGEFVINDLPNGSYSLRITKVGYEPRDIPVEVGSEAEEAKLNISLKPGVLYLNKEVVVSAQRDERSQFELPEVVSVMNQAQLRQQSPRSSAEALIGMPGVWLQKTNHGGGSPFVRGLTGNQTLLMIDGIRLNNAISRYGPNQYFNTIDPNSIGQIEVIRGSGSVQYGSDAIGGVVQVFTKGPDFSSDGLHFHGNAYGKWMNKDMEWSGRGELELQGENAAVYGGVSFRQFGDLVAGDNLTLDPSSYNEVSGDVKARFRIRTNHLLTLAYQHLKQEDVHRWDQVAQRGFQTWKFDPQERQLGYIRFQSFLNNKWAKEITITGSLNRSVEGRSFQREASSLMSHERDEVNTWGGIAEVHSQPLPNYRITSGIEYYFDQVSSTASEMDENTGMETSRRGQYPASSRAGSLALFTLHTLEINHWLLTYGGRVNTFKVTAEDETFNDIENSPTAIVGNIGLSYALHTNHRVFASLNSGFRAPNIDDLTKFGSFDSGFEVPITDLKPEKSLTTEVGVKSLTKVFSGTLSLFRTNLNDQIIRVPSIYNGSGTYHGEPVFRKENVEESYIQGVEAEVETYLLPALTAFGSLIYAYGKNKSNGEPMRRIPPLNGRLGLQYTGSSGIRGRAEWLYADQQDRLSGGDISDHRIPEGGTPGWNVINLYVGYAVAEWLQINVGLQNLTDASYRIHGSGVDGYGRNFWMALRADF